MALRDVALGAIIGLNNRLPITKMETVIGRAPAVWLRSAENIDITSGGLLRRRSGFSLSIAGDAHSIWSDKLDAYCVLNGELVHINHRTLARTTVAAAVGSNRISYDRLPDGMVYWTNGTRIGRLQGTAARALVTPTPNPVPIATATSGGLPAGRYQVCFTALSADGESASTEPVQINLPSGGGIAFSGLTGSTLVYATGPDGEVFNEVHGGNYLSLGNTGAPCDTFMQDTMPAGSALAHHKGSLLVARGRWLYISNAYRYGLFDLRRGFVPFPADISVVQPCEDGVYVCADKTYWIPGDPLATTPIVVLPYGALPGSAVFDAREQTAYWQGEQGAVIAKPGGAITVPQDDALTFTTATTGCTWLREQLGDKHLITSRFGATTP